MKKQKGSIEFIVIGIIFAAVLIAMGFGAMHVYNKAIEEKVAAKQEAETAKTAAHNQEVENAKLKTAAELLDKQSAARKGSDLKKADVERMITNGLQKVLASSPEARRWYDSPVPPDVLVSLRNNPDNVGDNKDGKGPVADAVGKPNTGNTPAVAPAVNDKRAITRLRSPFDKPTK